MPDGCRLAARMWLPEDALAHPVPAILEYIPYRKADWTALRDSQMHPYFAGHGYAAVRIDIRGSGDSEGLLEDEYLPLEQRDALEVLRWLAGQPWCTGAVGMIGKSWGGFSCLQVAAHRPQELKAVVSVCSTDDRYGDDVHYTGGCILATEMLPWASTFVALNSRPPTPENLGPRWRAMWLQRLESAQRPIETWLRHQRRDAYWKHGSVCEDYRQMACPVYMVGGWADGYRNAVLRLLAEYPGPCKGLIGPWPHIYPHEVVAPGPAIGFLQECLRWWDYWLKGIETGIMEEPSLRVWMQEAVEPHVQGAVRPGRWIAERSWPSNRVKSRRYALNAGTLDDRPGSELALEVTGVQTVGLYAGRWYARGNAVDLPPDQRLEDALSLTFTSAPLPERLEILGFPELTIALAADRENALIAVRLCEVSPLGSVRLITRGLLNLTHRESHEEPTPLEPGRRYVVRVRLNSIAYAVPAGHRVRVSASPTYWPWAWPSPKTVTLTLYAGAGSWLTLPIRMSSLEDDRLRAFEPPEVAPPLAVHVLPRSQSKANEAVIRREVGSGLAELTVHDDYGGYRRLLESAITIEELGTHRFSIQEGDPLSAMVRTAWTITTARESWNTRVETESTMSADERSFYVSDTLEAYEGDHRIFANSRSAVVPRDLV